MMARARNLAVSLALYGLCAGASAKQMPPAAEASVDWASRRLVARAQLPVPANARLWADVSAMGEDMATSRLQETFHRGLRALVLGGGAGTAGSLLDLEPRWQAWARRAASRYVVCHTIFRADGEVAIEAYLPLDDGPAQLGALWLALWQHHVTLAARADVGQAGQGRATAAPRAPSPPQAPAGTKNHVTAAAGAPTGFVVAAQGHGLRAAMWPRLVDGAGAVLYGPAALRPDAFASLGVASWHPSLQGALHDARVGERPTLVRARMRGPGANAELVVDDEDDAAALRARPELLRSGKVAIFLAPEADLGGQPAQNLDYVTTQKK